MIDLHTFIGGYPFRHVPHPEPEVLVRVLEREGVSGAWVGHLPSVFWRDPIPGNEQLFAALEPYPNLKPTPAVRPDWPGWRRTLQSCADRRVPGIRAYPPHWGLGPDSAQMRQLSEVCGEAGLALVLTARLEDLRQRHPLDGAGDLSAAAVRALARENQRTHLIVLAAGREMIEEIYWGLTTEERELIWFDISWIWGPPDDQLAHLFRTMGSERFVYGSGWPLRLAQTPRANLALLPEPLSRATLADPGTWPLTCAYPKGSS
jgi:hypothetical protein